MADPRQAGTGRTLAVQTHTESRLAQVTGWSDAQINLIQQTVAPQATRVELAWFLYNAKRLGLEPTLDQIYFIKYAKDKPGEIVPAIGGYRSMASESGEYAGSDDAIFEYEDVGQPEYAPSKASVTVYRLVQGQRCAFTASVRWTEFYPGPGLVGEQYRKRPHNQLAVRAESHALRKAFPYQSARMEAHEAAPREWVEAAEAPAPIDRELVARNAARYDAIFGDDDDGPPAVVEAPPAEPRWDAWHRNRELMEAAYAAGIRRPELRNTSTLEEIEQANADIEAQLELSRAAS